MKKIAETLIPVLIGVDVGMGLTVFTTFSWTSGMAGMLACLGLSLACLFSYYYGGYNERIN